MRAGMPQFEGKGANGRISELKNGRLAMIAVASFYAGITVPGSVPLLKGVIPAYAGECMAPFKYNIFSYAEMSQQF